MDAFEKDVSSLFLTPAMPGNTPAIVRTVQTKYGPRVVCLRPTVTGEVIAVVTEKRDGLKYSASLRSDSMALLKQFIKNELAQAEIR